MAEIYDLTPVEDATTFYPLILEYVIEKTKLSTCTTVDPKSGKIEGIEHAEWTLNMTKASCYSRNRFEFSHWDIRLEVTNDIPLKSEISYEIISETDSVFIHVCNTADSSKNFGEGLFLSREDLDNKFKNDKTLVLRVKALFSHTSKENQRIFGVNKMIQTKDWSQRLQNHVEKDFKLVVGNESVEIHKLFLTLESPVFARMLQEEKYKETQTGEMIITDFKFNTVKAVVAFCYGEDIADFIKFTKNAIELLMFIDKYDMANLKATFEEYYCKKLTKGNVVNIFVAASKVNANVLKAKCISFIQSLPIIEKTSLIYGALDEELHGLFADEI